GFNYVAGIAEDRSGVLWLTSVFGDGLNTLDVRTGEFARYSLFPDEPGGENMRGMTGIHEGADGTLWMTTMDNGLLSLDPRRKQFSRYLNGQTTRIFEDAEGVMWIGTRNRGVIRFPEKSLAFVNYQPTTAEAAGRQANGIQSVGADSQGDLWIGTSRALEMLNRNTGEVTLYHHDRKDPRSLSDASVFAEVEDRSGKMWFGTYGAGLNLLDRTTGKFTVWRHDPRNPDSLISDLIICLLLDSEGILW